MRPGGSPLKRARRLGLEPPATKETDWRKRDGVDDARVAQIKPIDMAVQTSPKEFLQRIEAAARGLLDSISPLDLAKAGVRDKAIAIGILMDKRALLRGEPTQILSHEERVRLPDVLKALDAEVRRRGLSVELPKTEYEVVEDG